MMRLGNVLRKWRRVEDKSLREAAADLGVSLATMHRLERGEEIEGRTLSKVLIWLMSEDKNGSSGSGGVSE